MVMGQRITSTMLLNLIQNFTLVQKESSNKFKTQIKEVNDELADKKSDLLIAAFTLFFVFKT